MMTRTTVVLSSVLMERANKHTDERGEFLSDFLNRAVLNQLEKEGDFEIRDLVEEDIKSGSRKE